MPQTTFLVAKVSGPERRQNRFSRQWFKVWTIDRVPDEAVSVQESLRQYETSNPWVASLCQQAQQRQIPVTVLWTDSPFLRVILEITLAEAPRSAA